MNITDFIQGIESVFGSYAKADKPGMKYAVTKYLEERAFTEEDLQHLYDYVVDHTSTLYNNRPSVMSIRNDAITIGLINTGPPEYEPIDFERPFIGEQCPERKEFLELREKLRKKHAIDMDSVTKKSS